MRTVPAVGPCSNSTDGKKMWHAGVFCKSSNTRGNVNPLFFPETDLRWHARHKLHDSATSKALNILRQLHQQMLYGVNLARRPKKIVKIARAFEVKPKNVWPPPNNAHFENRRCYSLTDHCAKYADKIMHAREGQIDKQQVRLCRQLPTKKRSRRCLSLHTKKQITFNRFHWITWPLAGCQLTFD